MFLCLIVEVFIALSVFPKGSTSETECPCPQCPAWFLHWNINWWIMQEFTPLTTLSVAAVSCLKKKILYWAFFVTEHMLVSHFTSLVVSRNLIESTVVGVTEPWGAPELMVWTYTVCWGRSRLVPQHSILYIYIFIFIFGAPDLWGVFCFLFVSSSLQGDIFEDRALATTVSKCLN